MESSSTINHQLINALRSFFSDLINKSGATSETTSMIENLIGSNKLNVLIADDDDDDKEIFEEAIRGISKNITVNTVSSGLELMDYLKSNDRPDLLFLDLNMPGKNGFECLAEIKISFKDLPVVIYSTSANIDQIDYTYKLGANLYIQKPSSFIEIKNILKKIFNLSYTCFISQPIRSEYLVRA